jgi:hypothetical protein
VIAWPAVEGNVQPASCEVFTENASRGWEWAVSEVPPERRGRLDL